MADTLKDFLVGLSFRIDQQGLSRFNAAVTGSTKLVRDFAVGITGMAVAAEEAIRRTARSFENLFYLSQQTGVSVQNLRQIRFAFGQVGSSADEAAQQLASFATSLRDNPGLRGLANQLVPGWKDAGDVVQGLTKQYRALMDRFGETGQAIEAQSLPLRNYIQLLGLNAETIRQNALNYEVFQKSLREAGDIYRQFGLNNQKAAENATAVARAWGKTWEYIKTGFDVFIVQTFPTVERLLTQFADWMGKEGAEKIKNWATQFGAWLDKKETIDNIKDTLVGIGNAAITIANGFDKIIKIDWSDLTEALQNIKNLVEWLGNEASKLNLFENTRREIEALRRELEKWLPKGEEGNTGPSKPSDALRLPPGLRRNFNLAPAPTVPPVVPGSPEFTAPIPGRRSDAGGIRATPASYGGISGGASDFTEALFYMLGYWLKGSTSMKPIITLADEAYDKIASAVQRAFGLTPGDAGGAGATNVSPGATPGRGRVGRFGGALRASPGGAGGVSLAQMKQLALNAGFSEQEASIMAAIAMHESSGNPFAVGKAGEQGVTQINPNAWGADLANQARGNPQRAMEIARMIYQKQGFAAWSSYNHGYYRQYLNEAQSAKPEPYGQMGPAGSGGRFRAGRVDLNRVRAALVSTINAAAGGLPAGYSVEATSGARTGGLANSQHHGGGALDVQIIGPDGKPISNQGSDVTGMYTRLAHSWFNQVAKLHPDLLDKAAWGGQFGITPGSPIADLMHFDFGGDRGRLKTNPWRYLDAPPLGGAGASSGGGTNNNINADHRVEINVHGTNDQHATARAVRDVIGRDYAMMTRNLSSAIA